MKFGKIAKEFGGKALPLKVCQSNRGFYLGTMDGFSPYSRESQEYFASETVAQAAMASGEWTQRDHP